MRQVKKRPSKGQFVMVWEYDNKVWSNTIEIVNGVAKVYNHEADYWLEEDLDISMKDLKPRYYVS